MASIKLTNISKVYEIKKEKCEAVKDFNLKINDKEFIVLVGPSGCGKSTTLRMIAGLEEITKGEIKIEEKVVNNILPKDRDIAMVFQNYALYPHMTVYQNMAFGLKIRRINKKIIDNMVNEAAQILDIKHLLKRKPKALSGGQRQRVALGRAIVRHPKVFLLDEPLSNLDAKLRTQMRTQISKLHKKIGTTFVYVTHDQTEAMTMADRIVVMKDGIIQQVGAPAELYNNPKNKFVAGFIGSPQMNFFEGILKKRGKRIIIDIQGAELYLLDEEDMCGKLNSYIDKKVFIGVRPEDICETINDKLNNTYKVKVDISELMGSETLVYLYFLNNRVISRFSPSTRVKSGDTVRVLFKANKVHLFDFETQERISKLKNESSI